MYNSFMEKYLKTNFKQQEILRLIKQNNADLYDIYFYKSKRYKFPVSNLMIVSREKLLKIVREYTRKSDYISEIFLGNEFYLYNIILPFTEEKEVFNVLKKIEFKLKKPHGYSIFQLTNESSLDNLINNSLFDIKEHFDTITY